MRVKNIKSSADIDLLDLRNKLETVNEAMGIFSNMGFPAATPDAMLAIEAMKAMFKFKDCIETSIREAGGYR